MKIKKLTLEHAMFIINKIMGEEIQEDKVELSDQENGLAEDSYSTNYKEIRIDKYNKHGDAFLNIYENGMVEWKVPEWVNGHDTEVLNQINGLEITDYLRKQGYKFKYKKKY